MESVPKAPYDVDVQTDWKEHATEMSTQTDPHAYKAEVETREIGIQVEINEEFLNELKAMEEARTVQEIREEITKPYEEKLFQTLAEQAFQNTRVISGNPLGSGGDLAIYTEDHKMEKDLPRKFRQIFRTRGVIRNK